MSNQNDLIASDINEYLSQHEHKEMLRLLTCGNVDDGKSTLIGRMLYDSKMIFEDQLAAVESDSVKHGTTGEKLDLALLVDGLAAEREQGITIDVAYRYFSTTKRKFIIADTPGHEQYTRNMATGASTCDLAIILIDARHGVQTQTKRHSFIASLLGIKHVVVAVNKMDLVDFSEDRYEEIKADYKNFVKDLDIEDFHFVPLSALNGDNVVNRSELSPWYTGQTLMEVLENVEISKDKNLTDFRMPVQYVNRPNLNFRGFAGNIASGIIKPGDSITALPSGKSSTVKSIVTYDGDLQEAFAGQAVTLTLNDEIDISRGDMIVKTDNQPATATRFNANIVWMTEAALTPGKVYDIKMASLAASGTFAKVHYQVDVNTMLRNDASELKLNEIGLCELTLNKEVAFDPYKANRATGSFIIIDRLTNVTVGAGMIVDAVEGSDDLAQAVTAEERAARFGQQAASLYFTGETKQAQAIALERRLFSMGHATALLTPDSLGDNADEKLGEKLTQAINQAGLIALCTFDAPVDAFVVGADTSTDDVVAQLQSKGII